MASSRLLLAGSACHLPGPDRRMSAPHTQPALAPFVPSPQMTSDSAP